LNIKFKRLLAAFIDYIIALLIVTILIFSFPVLNTLPMICLIGGGCTLIKDVFGKSVGKLILKLKIVDKNGVCPKFYILILRQILTPLWMIDVILVLNKNKKICDYWFNTAVVEN